MPCFWKGWLSPAAAESSTEGCPELFRGCSVTLCVVAQVGIAVYSCGNILIASSPSLCAAHVWVWTRTCDHSIKTYPWKVFIQIIWKNAKQLHLLFFLHRNESWKYFWVLRSGTIWALLLVKTEYMKNVFFSHLSLIWLCIFADNIGHQRSKMPTKITL